ncbi:thymidylate kinase [Anopheles gambiae]|uniref:Thymidylate kinase n=3 Tax=gambiae species complex TaxID=44542 RepID=A0A1S4GNP5_ANOGA|nr:thymidylate kinase [Anopheles coluzzii]XP_314179.4 thymidylate kinase [Anopheles gambiae]
MAAKQLAKLLSAQVRQNTRTISSRTFDKMPESQGKRGAFIVLEGCDRTGKTTQCKTLVDKLMQVNIRAQYMNFPDRSTQCGQLINGYLTRKDDFTDEGIHLLFTLNRWERMKEMEKLLKAGVNLIVDRYSYSGVAFSSAKGLDMEWCKAPESGLLKPDLVILLTLSMDALARRGGFGDERYEVAGFQKKVIERYGMLKDDRYWKAIDADKTFDDVTAVLYEEVLRAIEHSGDKPLEKLW